MKHLFYASILSAIAFLASACGQSPSVEHTHNGHDHGTPEKNLPTSAIAVFTATEGNDVSGWVLFEKVENGMQVTGRINHLTPGDHGFHVHQYGDLRKVDGTGTGGHFNPMDTPHAGRDAPVRHAGDMGNVTADANGVAEFSFVDELLTFEGPASIIGRGLIVHADPDDLTSQPTGNAGARVGMAVIGWANPEG